MEFSLSEEQTAIIELVDSLLADCTQETRDAGTEADGDTFDVACWKQLAEVGLTGIAVPESYGGSGLTFLDVCLVIEQLGKYLARVPFVYTTAFAGMVISRFGSEAQKQQYLPDIVSGDSIISAAVTELGAPHAIKSCRATPEAHGWLLTGSRASVPYAAQAQTVLVPATDTVTGNLLVFMVNTADKGITLTPVVTTHGEAHCHMTFSQVAVTAADCLADDSDGDKVMQSLALYATTATAFLNLGIVGEALRRTAEYTSERKQFGRPIGSFQGVALRAADAGIDLEAMRVTCWQAAWRLSRDEHAEAEVRVAKWWASDAASRIAHTAQHLHGGIGADMSYPIHKYFLAAKYHEVSLGAAALQLDRLGDVIGNHKLRMVEV